jgi:hypothetical protein
MWNHSIILTSSCGGFRTCPRTRNARIFIARVVRPHPGERLRRGDADGSHLLAVRDINPLFPRDTSYGPRPPTRQRSITATPGRCCRSGPPGTQVLRLAIDEPGVSACAVASATSTWEKNFGAWARLIRAHGPRKIPRLADQSFLNLLYFTQRVPMVRWPAEAICHCDWEAATDARLLHFLCSRRVHMSSYRIVRSASRVSPVGKRFRERGGGRSASAPLMLSASIGLSPASCRCCQVSASRQSGRTRRASQPHDSGTGGCAGDVVFEPHRFGLGEQAMGAQAETQAPAGRRHERQADAPEPERLPLAGRLQRTHVRDRVAREGDAIALAVERGRADAGPRTGFR